MSPAIGLIVASFAATAISAVIQHQEAKKKEKRLKALADRQKQLDQEKLAFDKKRKIDIAMAQNRALQSSAARLGQNRGLDTETDRFTMETTGRQSSLKGVVDSLETQAGFASTGIDIAADRAAEGARPPSLTAQLGVAGAEAASSVLAGQASTEIENKGLWG